MLRVIDLLIATNSRGKLDEFAQLLGRLPLSLRDLRYYGINVAVDETGATFAENAAIKASSYAKLAGVPALADDSGLVIDYLKGEPGVQSARYAGESATDRDRIEKILSQMCDADIRTARFVCVASFADERGDLIYSATGICEGTIALAPRGENGFGYDPIFVPKGFGRTFGELTLDVKQKISHRALAIAKIIPFLHGFFKI
jgi:XTP/dITP diphosphohydrolase